MYSLLRIGLTALCALTTTEASQAERHAMLKNRSGGKAIDRHIQKRQSQPSFEVPNAYLNDKTQSYWVNGSALPEVDFNIGESYAGTLPIDDTGKGLFFWFTPTVNPEASDEITLWLNGGPGCSSLNGFLHEQGSVIWQAGTYRPVPNTWAWVRFCAPS